MKLIPIDDLDTAVAAVESGRLVILPTRRWYMICAPAGDREACDRVFAGKGRARSKSLALVVPDLAAADDLFIVNSPARRLAAAFWPGDLALVLSWRSVRSGHALESVGVPGALVTVDPGPLGMLAARSRVPIAATTASISGGNSIDTPGPAITPAEVERFVIETGTDVAYCVDGGICPLVHHLTVVDCTGDEPKVVRPGVVHERAIQMAVRGVAPLPVEGESGPA